MDKTSFLTILGMGIATYITRVLGFYIAGKVKLTPRFRYALQSIPIAILVSIVAPTIIKGSIPEILSAMVVIGTAITGRGLLFCLAVGIMAINFFRYIF
ncbi:AzlD domain-containing protein [Seleniivibrio sp.]|uniref:AzlD family protein n=1 Tax=Seleniivibrio sp. TaxID=2898801 RepID=UPI0025DF507D|nr:AzlD domain-containing protein [Seleniivibrio sp.]MCD8554853.1 AzlD domain-containing protein [Seleniivibrio sp.]